MTNFTQPAYLIHTWGCQMNEDDSQQMANLLEQLGYRRTREEEDADVIMLNTCSVRAKPEQKVMSKLGELRLLKKRKPGLIICVCGCMAQREGESLLKRAPAVDLVMGTACLPDLPMLIQEIRQGGGRMVAIDLPERNDSRGKLAHIARTHSNIGLKAFIPVMYGCDNFCAYCVVPSARGPERSRPPEEVEAEISSLVARGCREVTLVGQNVNSYGGGSGVDFPGLLEILDRIDGLERIRFTTSHPKDLSERLIEAIAGLPKVCEHLHLPLQAGDDDILRRMGRGYTFDRYMSLVSRLRDRSPDIAVTTDLMVGFPGETEEQFRNTLRAVEKVRYDAAFMFAFNPRPGTAAARMDDQIDSATKTRRLNELIKLQNEITYQRAKEDEGRVFEVLVEGPSQKHPDRLTGYTRKNKTVNFPGGAELVGRLVRVRAVNAHPWGFSGELDLLSFGN